ARSTPSPLVGEGWGGGSLLLREARPPTPTPTPNPSPQGGGEPTESAARSNGKNAAPLLVVEKLVKEYPRKGLGGFAKIFQPKPPPQHEPVHAVDGISFTINRGESVGLVGESGCGKSTTSTMVMRLIDKSDGVIMFDGEDIGAIAAKSFAKLPLRKRIQMVFQDPTDSLNPRFTAARAIADPIFRLGDVKGPAAGRARGGALARQVGCRSSCSTAFRISCPADRRRAWASRGRSRSAPISSSSTNRRRRSTYRCRRSCSICCRSSRTRWG